MNLLLVILLLLFGLRLNPATSSEDAETISQTCQASTSGTVDRCSPTTIDGRYKVPAEGDVFHAVVNNGPVSPEYQTGYEIVVDADGTATITETPLGQSDGSDDGQAGEPVVRNMEIGADGLQALLADLDSCGFYYLPQRDEFKNTDLPVGGPVSILEVQLQDGSWETSGVTLEGPELTDFQSCQDELAARFGVTAPQ